MVTLGRRNHRRRAGLNKSRRANPAGVEFHHRRQVIVKQHGGRIEVETEPGAFSEFIITLPRDKGVRAV